MFRRHSPNYFYKKLFNGIYWYKVCMHHNKHAYNGIVGNYTPVYMAMDGY